jgi:predicted ATP-grasp superfamily ATP-dependent carboligase
MIRRYCSPAGFPGGSPALLTGRDGNGVVPSVAGPPAFVVSAQAPGLSVVRSLRRRGVEVTVATESLDEPAAWSRYASAVVVTPDPATDPEGCVDALLDAMPDGERPVVIPSGDDAICAMAHGYDRLAERCIVAGPRWPVAEWFIDKRRTMELAAKTDVLAPTSTVDLDSANAAAIAETLTYPVLVKPSQSHVLTRQTGLKMLAVESAAEFVDAVRLCEQMGVAPFAQEIVPGPPEHGVNVIVYIRGEEVVADFTARKVRNWPVDWGSPCALVSERITGLEERTRRLLVAAGFEGMACAEYKYDERCGDYQLMEINVRHNLSGTLAQRCGVDFAWIDYAHRAGLDTGPSNPKSWFEEGVAWIDSFRDTANMLTTGIWWRDPRAAIAPYRRPRAWAFFDLSDIHPFQRRARQLGHRGLGRIRRYRR